jgi:arylsulfatase A-like enzyme
MKNVKVIITLGILLSFFSIQGCRQKSTQGSRPSVILILTDDQGYGDLACHGNPFIKTPHLDELYSESIRFTNFHVNPFCSPTRAALLTGRFSDLTHVRTTINGRNHLNTEETTMAEYFKASGYNTGHFGKWHLGRNYPYRPIDRGFDQWVGHGDGGTGTASDYWGNDKMNDSYMRNGVWEKFEGFCTDIYFNEAINFINDNKEEPFFVYLATNVPHAPWNVLKGARYQYEEKLKQFEKSEGRSVVDFYATITRFDENLGRLRKFLSDNDLSKNTLLIFLTDNGTAGGRAVYNAGMRGAKGSVYEGGHRVPCFLHWEAEYLNKAADIDLMTSHIDILPTLIDLCDLKTPEKMKYRLSGESWDGLLRGEDTGWQDRTLFLHSQNITQQHEKWKNSLVATEEWRLVNRDELYNIKSDPEQEKNAAGEHPEILEDLHQKYEQYWKEIGEGKSAFQRAVIGSGNINETWLTCDAWIPENETPHTWNQSHVNGGVKNFGYWPVTIARNGTFQFEVRRWPKEVSCPMNAAPEAQTKEDIYSRNRPVLVGEGKIIPTERVELRIGDAYFEKEIGSNDEQAVFNIELEKGDTEIQAWLIDQDGMLHPAYYVYVNQ